MALQLGQQGIVAAADFRLAFARQAVVDLRHAGKRAVHDGVAIALAAFTRLQDFPRRLRLRRPLVGQLRGKLGRGPVQHLQRRRRFVAGRRIALAEYGIIEHEELARAALHGQGALGQTLRLFRQGNRLRSRLAPQPRQVLQGQQGLHGGGRQNARRQNEGGK